MTRAAAGKESAIGVDPAPGDAFSELIAATRAPRQRADFGGPALERRSISEQVANRIMGMIKSGNLKSGDRLPTEAQMTIAFGISRPPLREALKALTLMGVLESRQGGRYTVTDLSPSRLVAPFNVMLSVTDYDVDEHFEARALVDVELVRLCTLRATPEWRQRILKLAVDGRAFHHDPVAFRLLDIEFHQALNQGARNQLLTALSQGLYDVGLDVRRVASAVPGVIEKSVAQHVEVAEAVSAGDAPAAVAAYRRHLEHVRDTTIQSMVAARLAE
ncbi:MAG: FadR family transcriptional regulator [Devosia sp.]|nr:FadR family transcriptional regulator [Devosia sp.]